MQDTIQLPPEEGFWVGMWGAWQKGIHPHLYRQTAGRDLRMISFIDEKIREKYQTENEINKMKAKFGLS